MHILWYTHLKQLSILLYVYRVIWRRPYKACINKNNTHSLRPPPSQEWWAFSLQHLSWGCDGKVVWSHFSWPFPHACRADEAVAHKTETRLGQSFWPTWTCGLGWMYHGPNKAARDQNSISGSKWCTNADKYLQYLCLQFFLIMRRAASSAGSSPAFGNTEKRMCILPFLQACVFTSYVKKIYW